VLKDVHLERLHLWVCRDMAWLVVSSSVSGHVIERSRCPQQCNGRPCVRPFIILLSDNLYPSHDSFEFVSPVALSDLLATSYFVAATRVNISRRPEANQPTCRFSSVLFNNDKWYVLWMGKMKKYRRTVVIKKLTDVINFSRWMQDTKRKYCCRKWNCFVSWFYLLY
jgi:hypothetical protein